MSSMRFPSPFIRPCSMTRTIHRVALSPGGLTRTLIAVSAAIAASSAAAVDGCEVLLCLAAPNWRSVSPCVPTVTQVLRDLARGEPLPSCAMGGSGNSANHTWSAAPEDCPPQYTLVTEGPHGPRYSCTYDGSITVSVVGAPFTRTWWSTSGDAVTEFYPAAKQQLGTWDRRFEDDHDAWLRRRPAPLAQAH